MKIGGRNFRVNNLPLWRILELMISLIWGKVLGVSRFLQFPFIHLGVKIQNWNARIQIGSFCEIHDRVVISAVTRDLNQVRTIIKIGSYTTIWYGTVISAKHSIEIGENCAISWNCTIIDDDMHTIKYTDTENFRKVRGNFVKIGNRVWIGANSIILKGVTINDNVIVAAGSVVRDDIPSNSIVSGNPARIMSTFLSWE
jgi:acetyltransferase-like isoleucine patch superfamily enzyme